MLLLLPTADAVDAPVVVAAADGGWG